MKSMLAFAFTFLALQPVWAKTLVVTNQNLEAFNASDDSHATIKADGVTYVSNENDHADDGSGSLDESLMRVFKSPSVDDCVKSETTSVDGICHKEFGRRSTRQVLKIMVDDRNRVQHWAELTEVGACL